MLSDLAKCQNGLAMIMVTGIMAVAVHGPCDVLQQSMAMTMLLNHFGMLMQSLDKFRRMADSGNDRPDRNGQAQQDCKCASK